MHGQESRDLRTLLGLPPAAPAALVKSTYEQHMSAALRSGNHRRADQLSRAFDDQPLADRRSVYAGAGSLPPRFAADAERAVRRPRRVRRRGRRLGRRVATRIGVYAIVIPVAVVVGVAVMLHIDPHVPGSWTGPHTPAPGVQLRVAPTTTSGPWWQVPAGAPIDADGRVAVWCHDSAGNGTTSRLAPGQVFTCPAGQVAVIGDR